MTPPPSPASPLPPSRTPLPTGVEDGDLVLRRWEPPDAPALHDAVLANLDHLRPFMPWVAFEPLTVDERVALIEQWERDRLAGGDVLLGVFLVDPAVDTTDLTAPPVLASPTTSAAPTAPVVATGLTELTGPSTVSAGSTGSLQPKSCSVIVGGSGLHRRIGPHGLEIGYWIDHRRQRAGLATRVARLLTTTAFALPGIDTVEIHCDAANAASARIPEKLGFALADTTSVPVKAPGERGEERVYRMTRTAWSDRRGQQAGTALA